jgi:hypothetical protein
MDRDSHISRALAMRIQTWNTPSTSRKLTNQVAHLGGIYEQGAIVLRYTSAVTAAAATAAAAAVGCSRSRLYPHGVVYVWSIRLDSASHRGRRNRAPRRSRNAPRRTAVFWVRFAVRPSEIGENALRHQMVGSCYRSSTNTVFSYAPVKFLNGERNHQNLVNSVFDRFGDRKT